ncbi:MAG: hypothetical protein LDL33_14485 [Desulfomonile sp.]|nr:hypothetical protein [Desulfomonile sp.]
MNKISLRRLTAVWVVAALLIGFGIVRNQQAYAAWLENESGGDHNYYWNTFENPKFRYHLTSRQWWHYASYGSGWYAVSALDRPSTFIGNGGWHDLGNGFTYQYTTAYDVGYFKDGGTYRFRYKYGPGQWENTANILSWQALGSAGLSAAFLGSGAWWNLGNGFTYQYTTAYDVGYFKTGGTYRFRYKYGTGQWESTGSPLSWQALGNAGLSASFLGDQVWHNLGNGFWYRYLTGSDDAYWSRDGTDSGNRFHYWYGTGQWEHRGAFGDWNDLGAGERSASFIGTNVAKQLGNDWWYTYYYGSDNAYWTLTSDPDSSRFTYKYDTGQWRHRGYGGSWHNLGASERSALFVGNYVWHDLRDGWWYRYMLSEGEWSRDGTDAGHRLRYYYYSGLWCHFRDNIGWSINSSSNPMSSAFIGDGKYHDMGTIGSTQWYFQYFRIPDASYWSLDGTDNGDRFTYFYSTGLWRHRGIYGGVYNNLGHAGISCWFVGDGMGHNLNNGYTYQWTATNLGVWTVTSTGANAYRYEYDLGYWRQWNVWHGWWDFLAGPSVGTNYMNPGE